MSEEYGFILLRDEQIPEISTRARLYRHSKTGAELLSLINADENKAFGIAFRTPPTDSTGVAHILEHSVLAGSRKYQLKDPFAELLKGSQKTFLNALTYPDKTVYPVASTNLKDFYNLVDVYLDTVFFPLLRPQTFAQQGWHYELDAADGALSYKGVVFNEMKGVYSAPDSLLYRTLQQTLYPDNTYGVDSGGDPAAIIDLRYEDLKAFHQRYYHPSNALICFAGDDDPTERLRILDGYLSQFDRATIAASVAPQPVIAQARRVERSFPASAGETKSMLSVAWLLQDAPDLVTELGLGLLDNVLLGTTAAPLRKILTDSGLGEKLTGSGMNSGLLQTSFFVGMKGVAPDQLEDLEQLIDDSLLQLAKDGIDPAQVEAAMNSAEFAMREQNSGSFPRGLSLYFSALNRWLHGKDPIEELRFADTLAALKAEIAANPRYFSDLIERYILSSQHRVTVVLRPDAEHAARIAAREQARLAAEQHALDAAARAQIAAEAAALKHWQETPDDPAAVAAIPTLQLSDLNPKITTIPTEEQQRAGTRVLFHDLPTNGIVYFNLALDAHTLPQELLPYLPLFGRCLTELGTATESPVQLKQRIGRTTGGVGAGSYTSAVRGSQTAVTYKLLSGKATVANGHELLAIMRDVLLTTNFGNRERFRQMVLESKASLEGALVPSGNSFASTRLRARYNEADWLDEQRGGIAYLFFIRELATLVDSDWDAVQARLEQIRDTLLRRGGALANVTLDAAGYQIFGPQLDAFLAELPDGSAPQVAWTPQYQQGSEALVIPAQVNYVAKGADLYKLGYKLHGSVSVVARHLRTVYLWEKVRVQGGAYGGGGSFDSYSGVWGFSSYRDPNLLKTLEVYDAAGAYLRQLTISPADLSRTIIGTIGDMDGYQLPDSKGYTALVRTLVGYTDEERQKYRDQVLGTTAADVRAFAEWLDAVRDHGTVAVVGGSAAVEGALAERPGAFAVVPVL